MDLDSSDSFRLEFEAADVWPVAEDVVRARPYRIGWLVKSVDVNSASIRYRCFHFARVLAPRFESVYFTSANELQHELPKLDAVIIVKRLDKTLPALVATARLSEVPVFLDLCDDMMGRGYSKNESGVNLVRFVGMAPFLAGVTVPSAEMASRIEGYVAGNGLMPIPIHVIPDIAETWDIYRTTNEAVTGEMLPAHLPPVSPASGLKKVVWFGNYGASHSNFGIFSLKSTLKSLRAVNPEIPLELVVISNSEPVYRALVHNCGFSTRYVPWSAQAVYSELASADAALLTTGDDDFCDIKSSSRVLQAFAAGVPVITAKGSAVAEFDEAIAIGRMQDALRNCLGPGRETFVRSKLAAAQHVLARYTPESIGKIWATLLKSSIANSRERQAARQRDKLLIVLQQGDSVETARDLMRTVKNLPDLDYVLLVSTELVASDPEFSGVLRLSRRIPRFFTGVIEGVHNLLLDCSAVIVERQKGANSRLLGAYSQRLGIPVLTSAEAAWSGLDAFVRPKSAPPTKSAIRAGPYEERLNPDGTLDWVFVVNEKARGWILDAIAREIGSRQPASWLVSYYPAPTPEAKNYFFSHHALFESFVDREADRLKDAKVFVWYTHPRVETPASVAKLLLAFEQHVTKVIFACESNRQIWIERGLAQEKTAVVLGAADPEMFRFHERGGGVVGLSSSFYERKNPDCLMAVMKLLPHREFVLLGRKWHQYALFEEMKALLNFTYKSAPYRDYPAIYATFDVFLSISQLEGGPIPLVEAMMSNSVPVASRTGFAPDLIKHGENGFIFNLDASAETIAEMIEAAFDLSGDIRKTVEDLSWDNFSAEIVKMAE